jgi:flagellar basal body-associated protein FliL
METPVLIDEEDTTNTFQAASGSNVSTSSKDTTGGVLVDRSSELDEENESSKAPKAPDQENVIVVYGSLTYDNVPAETPKNDDPLMSDSLHTTNSQESMDIASFVPHPESPKQEDALLLSFHASQVDSSELKYMELTTAADNFPFVELTTALESSSTQEEGHNLEVLVNVGNQLLRQEEEEEEAKDDESTKAPKKSSKGGILKILALALTLVAIMCIAMPSTSDSYMKEGMDPIMNTESAGSQQGEEKVFIPSLNNSTIEEREEPTIVVEEYVAQDDNTANLESSALLSWTQIMKAAWSLFLMVFVALLSTSSSPPQQAKTDESSETPPEEESFEEGETEPQEEDSMLKNKELLDLSQYEMLKVVELRELLRSRKCKTMGKKVVLIQRLTAVYQAELETLTVRQLRPILKSKGCKQAGRKSELIWRVVEAGL